MDKPFPAYEGDQPYLFVSYAHDDDALVYEEMNWLNEAGFNLWYDDGIHVGTVWRQALADALLGASGLVFFSTAKSVESSNCLKEINFALDDEKPVFVVQLDDTPLPSLLRLSLSDRQAMLKSAYEEESYRSRLTTALATVVPQRHLVNETDSEELEHVQTEVTCVAIVPFRALGKDDELRDFADCVTSSVANRLHHRIFNVVTVEEDVQVGDLRELYGAHYALTAIFRGTSLRLRGTFRLTDTSNGRHVWSQDVDIEESDILTAEDEVVFQVDNALSRTVIEIERHRLAGVEDEALNAFGLCVRAAMPRLHGVKDRTFDLLRLAIRRDPDLLWAHALYAESLAWNVTMEASSDPEEDARIAIQHADIAIIRGNPNYSVSGLASLLFLAAEAHGLLGNIERNWFIARRANDLMKSPQNMHYLSALMRIGDFRQVIDIFRQGRPMMMHTSTLSLLAEGELDEALAMCTSMSAGYPSAMVWMRLAAIQACLGDTESVNRSLARAREKDPDLSVARYLRIENNIWHNDQLLNGLTTGFAELGLIDDA